MKRALFIALVALSVLIGVGGLVYAFGTPQAPDVAAPAAASGAAPVTSAGGAQVQPEPAAQAPGGVPAMGGGDPSAVGKKAPPADPGTPLAIEIPGCVCHSDDPKLVDEHAGYRMNQCAGCHMGAPPTGQ